MTTTMQRVGKRPKAATETVMVGRRKKPGAVPGIVGEMVRERDEAQREGMTLRHARGQAQRRRVTGRVETVRAVPINASTIHADMLRRREEKKAADLAAAEATKTVVGGDAPSGDNTSGEKPSGEGASNL